LKGKELRRMGKPSRQYGLYAQLISPVYYMARPVNSVGEAPVALQSIARNTFFECWRSAFVLVGTLTEGWSTPKHHNEVVKGRATMRRVKTRRKSERGDEMTLQLELMLQRMWTGLSYLPPFAEILSPGLLVTRHFQQRFALLSRLTLEL
jgi:hypothetical protein